MASLPTKQDTIYINQLQAIIPQFSQKDSIRYYAELSLSLSQAQDHTKGKIEALWLLGDSYLHHDEFALALNYFGQLQPILQAKNDIDGQLSLLCKQALIARQKGQSAQAMELLLAGRALADQYSTPQRQTKILHALGDFHRLQHNWDKAVDFFEQAKAIHESEAVDKGYCRLMSTLATTYKSFEETAIKRKGIALLEEMLTGRCGENASKRSRAITLNNLGSAYTFVGDFENAKLRLDEALILKREIGNGTSTAYTLNELSSLYYHLEQYQRAVQYATEAETLVQNNIFLQHDILENLMLNHAALGQYQQAYQYQTIRQELMDSVYTLEKNNTLAQMAADYELAQKEQALIVKDLEIALQENKYNRTLTLGLILLSFIAGLFFWARYRWLRQKAQAQQLIELDQLKSHFFTNITHEFRTPLSLILHTLPKAKGEGELTIGQQEALILERNARRLNTLIDQLLDLSKLEAGKMQLQVGEQDLSQFLKNLVRSFESMTEQKGIRLQFVSRQSPLHLFFDADKVEKIMYNLLSNAIKFTPADGEINVLVDIRDAMVEIMVKDDGPGIPTEQLPYIFDRFYQADDSSTRAFEGTGIGLALTQQMVKVHRGDIRVESELSRGTSFFVRLPLKAETYGSEERVVAPVAKVVQAPQAERVPSSPIATPPLETSLPLVLIVEDNADLRYVLRQQLQVAYQIVEAENGQTGLALAIELVPDLIVSDVMMPEMDGYAFCQALKADDRTSHIPVVLLTAKATRAEKIEGLEKGADSYLIKPFDPEELELRVRNLIAQRQQLQRRFAQKVVYQPRELTTVVSREEVFLKNIFEIMERELANEAFGVEALSRAAHMSRSQLYRKIKALTGDTPNALLRQFRLERARQLLEKDAGNVSEIAQMVGFSNANYFYKCFKDQFGHTPGEILKG